MNNEQLPDGMKVDSKLYTRDEIGDGQIVDVEEPKMSALSIPKLNKMMDSIINMVQYIQTPEMVNMKKNDNKQYELTVYHKYKDHMSPKIIDLLLEDLGNLKDLIEMFEQLTRAQLGQTSIESEYEKFTDKVNNKWLYPSFGGKEGYDKTIAKLNKQAHNNNKQ